MSEAVKTANGGVANEKAKLQINERKLSVHTINDQHNRIVSRLELRSVGYIKKISIIN